MQALAQIINEISIADYDAVFYPGGHGYCGIWRKNPVSIALIEQAIESGKPVATVCHAPRCSSSLKTSDGKPLVSGKSVTGFTNTEEAVD